MAGDIKRMALSTRQAVCLCAGLVTLLLAPGCATLDKDECLVADWRLIGYQDGVAGKSGAVVGEYREDCAKYAVVPDLDAYQAGREEGLVQYCKPGNGFRLGEAGRAYSAVCTSGLEAGFRAAYNDGREIYLARSKVKRTHSLINKRQQTIKSLEQDKVDKLLELVQDGLRREQRLLLLYEIHEIEEEIDVAETEVSTLEHDLQDHQGQLDDIRVTNSH